MSFWCKAERAEAEVVKIAELNQALQQELDESKRVRATQRRVLKSLRAELAQVSVKNVERPLTKLGLAMKVGMLEIYQEEFSGDPVSTLVNLTSIRGSI